MDDRRRRNGCAHPPRPTARRAGARRLLASLAAAGAIALPAPAAPPSALAPAPMPTAFSAGTAGGALPHGWVRVKLSERKTPTAYALVDDDGVVVLHAKADAAASGLAQFTVFDVRSAPVAEWRWKVSELIDGADNRVAAREDSPARVVFAFDGDKSRLPFVERAVFYLSEKISGRELPYALLQYVWSNRLPVGAVLEHPYTRRVRMLVVASGAAGVGKWQSYRRNVYDDYRTVFDEEPGRLTGIGVLTDTDNTGASVEAWYGDIRLLPAER